MFVLFLLLFVIDIILFDFISFFIPLLRLDVEFYSLAFVLFHGISVLVCIIFKEEEYRNLFVAAFALRLFLMFADLYHWFPVLHSGADSESFHVIAVYNQISTPKQWLTNYTEFLTVFYSVAHSSRILAQYVNVMFGMGIIFIIKDIFRKLELDSDIQRFFLTFLVFSPNLIIFSGILLREAWIEYFIALSVYCFISWFLGGGAKFVVGACASVMLASYMHDGTLVVLTGYIVAFLTYNPFTKEVQISRQSIFSFILLGIGMMFLSRNSSMFATRMSSVESADTMTEMLNNKTIGGGSAYLTWIHSDSLLMSFVFAPLKMFYFLYSPLPTNWRGMGDIIAFIIDSSVYLYLSWKIYKNKVLDLSKSLLKNYLLIGIGIAVFVFAFGTYTAGTAMRHRAKLLSIIVVTCAVTSDPKKLEDD